MTPDSSRHTSRSVPESPTPQELPSLPVEKALFITELSEMIDRFRQQDFTGNLVRVWLRSGHSTQGFATDLRIGADGSARLELDRVHRYDIDNIGSVHWGQPTQVIRYQGLD
ncbi:MAG: hypothetical protein K1X79_10030 [Oligoflexia bacterium]|nr:hypothetical protein [Oligoflexia bacterium]